MIVRDHAAGSAVRLPRLAACMRLLQCSLALVLGFQGLVLALSEQAYIELAAGGIPSFVPVVIGATELIAALMLLRDRWVGVAVAVLLCTFLAVIGVHVVLGRINFLNLIYASAALLAVLTYRREVVQ